MLFHIPAHCSLSIPCAWSFRCVLYLLYCFNLGFPCTIEVLMYSSLTRRPREATEAAAGCTTVRLFIVCFYLAVGTKRLATVRG